MLLDVSHLSRSCSWKKYLSYNQSAAVSCTRRPFKTITWTIEFLAGFGLNVIREQQTVTGIMPHAKRKSLGGDGKTSSKASKASKASLDPTADRILTWLLSSKLQNEKT